MDSRRLEPSASRIRVALRDADGASSRHFALFPRRVPLSDITPHAPLARPVFSKRRWQSKRCVELDYVADEDTSDLVLQFFTVNPRTDASIILNAAADVRTMVFNWIECRGTEFLAHKNVEIFPEGEMAAFHAHVVLTNALRGVLSDAEIAARESLDVVSLISISGSVREAMMRFSEKSESLSNFLTFSCRDVLAKVGSVGDGIANKRDLIARLKVRVGYLCVKSGAIEDALEFFAQACGVAETPKLWRFRALFGVCSCYAEMPTLETRSLSYARCVTKARKLLTDDREAAAFERWVLVRELNDASFRVDADVLQRIQNFDGGTGVFALEVYAVLGYRRKAALAHYAASFVEDAAQDAGTDAGTARAALRRASEACVLPPHLQTTITARLAILGDRAALGIALDADPHFIAHEPSQRADDATRVAGMCFSLRINDATPRVLYENVAATKISLAHRLLFEPTWNSVCLVDSAGVVVTETYYGVSSTSIAFVPRSSTAALRVTGYGIQWELPCSVEVRTGAYLPKLLLDTKDMLFNSEEIPITINHTHTLQPMQSAPFYDVLATVRSVDLVMSCGNVELPLSHIIPNAPKIICLAASSSSFGDGAKIAETFGWDSGGVGACMLTICNLSNTSVMFNNTSISRNNGNVTVENADDARCDLYLCDVPKAPPVHTTNNITNVKFTKLDDSLIRVDFQSERAVEVAVIRAASNYTFSRVLHPLVNGSLTFSATTQPTSHTTYIYLRENELICLICDNFLAHRFSGGESRELSAS